MKKKPTLTKEEHAKLAKEVQARIRWYTPLQDNKCYCGGEVVKKVTGFFYGKFEYSFPECRICARVYYYADAKKIRAVGEKEFREILERPYAK